MQAIMGLAEQNKKLLDIFKIKSPKNYDNYIKTKSQKPEKTLEEALKDGDFNIISEGDEGYKEISERLGITARPGDNLSLDDNEELLKDHGKEVQKPRLPELTALPIILNI